MTLAGWNYFPYGLHERCGEVVVCVGTCVWWCSGGVVPIDMGMRAHLSCFRQSGFCINQNDRGHLTKIQLLSSFAPVRRSPEPSAGQSTATCDGVEPAVWHWEVWFVESGQSSASGR